MPRQKADPKTPRKPREPKVPKVKADNPRAAKGGNKVELSPDQMREAFLHHNTKVIGLRAKADAARTLLNEAYTDAKSDGFAKKKFDIARFLSSPKTEHKVKAEVAERLQVARWMGHPLGAQMDMFNEPDRTPVVDRAYDAGKQASMENRQRTPPHDPSTDAYRAWMAGYDDHQRELHGGFKAAVRPDQVENRLSGGLAATAPMTDIPPLVAAGEGDDDE